ncbi:MAG: glycosyl hydrolase family 28-related protein [Opitutaceae bacterium]
MNPAEDTTRLFNIRTYGAVGDGTHDDSAAIQSAMEAAVAANACLYIPAGEFKITQPLLLNGLESQVAIRGDGANISIVVAHGGTSALSLTFEQLGAMQPWGLNLMAVGFRARGRAGTAITVSYGNPQITNEHYRPSVVLRNVVVASDHLGSWSNGISITAAWNISMSDVHVSGDSAGGNWNAMTGSGIELNRMCVNAHFTNVRCSFWATGFYYHAAGGGNTEGIFFTNCSIIGVQRGVWITGNSTTPAPRVSTVTWTGGLIECRVGGVEGGSAAFHFVNVWTALITGVQLIAETLPATHTTYGVFADNCAGLVLTGCDLNAWHYGLFTVGNCRAINSHGNTYTNCAIQNCFNQGTVASRSYGHVLFNNPPNDQDHPGVNKLGFV